MEHPRDEATEAVLGDISHKEVMSSSRFSTTPMVWKNRVKKQTTVIEKWRRKAPVTQCRRKKDTVMTAPVTERSPARYIY